jgi:S-methylmethionine-dependent homocysteine/selenocysteine methylase
MSKYRNTLPQLDDRLFLADGGIETTLIFHDGLDLPYFAAFDLLARPEGESAEEAIGIARAAKHAGMPVVLSFTVETDGKLPTGQTLKAAIEAVEAATARYPAYYMVNCAHPSHFERVLAEPQPYRERVRGVRANASRMSHAELNEAAELDAGNPAELAADYARLEKLLPRLNVMGGCCGTDHRHIEAIAAACTRGA